VHATRGLLHILFAFQSLTVTRSHFTSRLAGELVRVSAMRLLRRLPLQSRTRMRKRNSHTALGMMSPRNNPMYRQVQRCTTNPLPHPTMTANQSPIISRRLGMHIGSSSRQGHRPRRHGYGDRHREMCRYRLDLYRLGTGNGPSRRGRCIRARSRRSSIRSWSCTRGWRDDVCSWMGRDGCGCGRAKGRQMTVIWIDEGFFPEGFYPFPFSMQSIAEGEGIGACLFIFPQDLISPFPSPPSACIHVLAAPLDRLASPPLLT
jgi:hypothetical protein